jgi:hypothetical protein
MKALSVRQPWCHAILRLGKRVENRAWQGCSYRGPVMLHASKTLVLRPRKGEPETFGDAIDSILAIEQTRHRRDLLEPMARWDMRRGLWRPAPTLPFGGIVGRARIVDVIFSGRFFDSRLPEPTSERLGEEQGRWYAGGFALVLTDVEPISFFPCSGALGLFECEMP